MKVNPSKEISAMIQANLWSKIENATISHNINFYNFGSTKVSIKAKLLKIIDFHNKESKESISGSQEQS